MAARLAEFVAVFLMFIELFTTVFGDPACSHGYIVYARDQLLAYWDTAALLAKERHEVAHELRRKRRAGAKCRARRIRFKPVLPSIIMGNVRSLLNKMDELSALTHHRRDSRECSHMVFTETWLTEITADMHVKAAICYSDSVYRWAGGRIRTDRLCLWFSVGCGC